VLQFDQYGIIDISSGTTLTINGPIDAGIYQIFDISADGYVEIGDTTTTVYPEWWGASPSASAADNTIAFQAALDSGKEVRVGQGTYSINSLTMNVVGTRLVGTGYSTILEYAGSGTFLTINPNIWSGCVVEDLRIDSTATSLVGIQLGKVYGAGTGTTAGDVHLNRIRIHGFDAVGGAGISGEEFYNCHISRCIISNCETGIQLGENVINNEIQGCWVRNWTDYGIYIDDAVGSGSYNTRIDSCIIDEPIGSTGTAAVYLKNAHASIISNCHFELSTVGIYIASTSVNNNISNNLFDTSLTTAIELESGATNTVIDHNRYSEDTVIDAGNSTMFRDDQINSWLGDGGYLDSRVIAGVSDEKTGYFNTNGVNIVSKNLIINSGNAILSDGYLELSEHTDPGALENTGSVYVKDIDGYSELNYINNYGDITSLTNRGYPAAASPLSENAWVITGSAAGSAYANNLTYTPFEQGAADTIELEFVSSITGSLEVEMLYAMSVANTGDVSLQLDYLVLGTGDDPTTSITTQTAFTITPGNDALLHTVSSADDSSMLIDVTAGDSVYIKITRPTASDTHTGDMRAIRIRGMVI
jgi:hypothetical protein